VSLTVPITKQDVLVQLIALGVTTPAQVQTFITESRQFEAGAACNLAGESNGNTIMQQIMAALQVANNLQWVSRKLIRHYAKQLLAEGAL
jgi:hypothetical protein